MKLNADKLKKAAKEAEMLRIFLAEGHTKDPLNALNIWDQTEVGTSTQSVPAPEGPITARIRRRLEATGTTEGKA